VEASNVERSAYGESSERQARFRCDTALTGATCVTICFSRGNHPFNERTLHASAFVPREGFKSCALTGRGRIFARDLHASARGLTGEYGRPSW
jgi:hypothetical protein